MLGSVRPGTSIASCLGRWRGAAFVAAGPVVRRVGVETESVSFRDRSGRWLLGCDDSTGRSEDGRRWCGSPAGRLFGGRLRDPRLGILCTTAEGDDVGFAWVQPRPGARYVAVEQPGYVEVYEVAGGLPVRIATTSGVVVDRSRARFDVSEHDVLGMLLRRYELDAGVAG